MTQEDWIQNNEKLSISSRGIQYRTRPWPVTELQNKQRNEWFTRKVNSSIQNLTSRFRWSTIYMIDLPLSQDWIRYLDETIWALTIWETAAGCGSSPVTDRNLWLTLVRRRNWCHTQKEIVSNIYEITQLIEFAIKNHK